MKKNIVAGINGFGRFGLHLLKFYLDRSKKSSFEIKYINDEVLSIEQAFDILKKDKYVKFNKIKILRNKDLLSFQEPDGSIHEIVYSTNSKENLKWVGEVDLFLECSGRYSEKNRAGYFLKGKTSHVLISQTSWDCDKTLVFGFNHEEYDASQKIISYGSCTVNAYVPFAKVIQEKYGIVDSDVNVIHNIQEYRLKENYTLIRKFCTLEKSGVLLLPFIKDRFYVNYTVIPYDGVSTIDFRFKLDKKVNRHEFIADLKVELSNGRLSGLYDLDKVDIGPEIYSLTPYSSVFIEDRIEIVNNNVYIFGYFDNENSVNRYYDLVNYISDKL